MHFLNRKTFNYIHEQMSKKYQESSLGNAWYVLLFSMRVLIFYFLFQSSLGATIKGYFYYLVVGNLFFELFRDFCNQCLENAKKGKKIKFEGDQRLYYLLYEGVASLYYLPILVIAALFSHVNLLKFAFFFSVGAALFITWMYYLSYILIFISHRYVELKFLIKMGMTYLMFLTPIFWGATTASNMMKQTLFYFNPLSYFFAIPRFATQPVEPFFIMSTLGILAATYAIAKGLQWYDQKHTTEEQGANAA